MLLDFPLFLSLSCPSFHSLALRVLEQVFFQDQFLSNKGETLEDHWKNKKYFCSCYMGGNIVNV
jgi:hypothetical protein